MYKQMYLLKVKAQELYIHYNPHTYEYFLSDKILGAVGFDYDNAINIKQELGNDFEMIEIPSSSNMIKTHRDNEPELYDNTH
jgi:hypothetical protein